MFRLTYIYFCLLDFDLEAPAILKTDSRYYIFMSHKTGYRPNNVVVFSSESLSGPWSVQSYVAPLGTRTYNSQSTMSITVNGTSQKTYVYCGDQWTEGTDLYDSAYVWLPVDVDDGTGLFRIEDFYDLWLVDVKTGEVSVPEGVVYEAEEGEVVGGAYATLCVSRLYTVFLSFVRRLKLFKPTCSGNGIVTGSKYRCTLTSLYLC